MYALDSLLYNQASAQWANTSVQLLHAIGVNALLLHKFQGPLESDQLIKPIFLPYKFPAGWFSCFSRNLTDFNLSVPIVSLANVWVNSSFDHKLVR